MDIDSLNCSCRTYKKSYVTRGPLPVEKNRLGTATLILSRVDFLYDENSLNY